MKELHLTKLLLVVVAAVPAAAILDSGIENLACIKICQMRSL
jgi:hypothetical protein